MTSSLARLFTGSMLAAAVCSAWGAPPDDSIVRFDISRFEVVGNTLLPPAQVDAALAPFAGKGRDFGDVQRALEALEAAYRERGYNVVQVGLPEQELNRGVVRFTVVQTKVGRVTVSGNGVFDEANVRRSLPALREGQTPNLRQVSAALKLANENPAKKVTMKLASGGADDEVDVGLDVADERAWKATLNLDNSGTDQTGKTHAGLVLQHANLFGRDHVGTLQYSTTLEKPSQVNVYAIGYHVPLYALGDALDLYATYSNVDSGSVVSDLFNLSVSGRGAVYGARYSQVLARRGNYDARLAYGLDVKAFKSSVLFAGQDFGKDVTVHPLSLGYLGQWSMADGDASVSLTLVRNIPGGSRGGQEDLTRARKGASANYTIARFAGAATRVVWGDWQARAIVNGQYSADALVPGEQFGAGGAASVRGFGERELSNDSGLVANLELYTPNTCAARAAWQCRFVAFVDGAHVRRNDAELGELESGSIASAGIGLRLAFGTSMQMQLDVGHVLNAGPFAGADKNTVHLRVGLSY